MVCSVGSESRAEVFVGISSWNVNLLLFVVMQCIHLYI